MPFIRKLFLLSVVLLATACGAEHFARTSMTWKDSAYHSAPRKIMVIGVSKSPVRRRAFEDEFVRQLNAWGMDAVASYTVLPDSKQDDRDSIARKVRELRADAVLITRLTGKKTEQTYVPGTPYLPPPYYGTWPDYYGYGYQDLYTPGYVVENEYAVVESNLYDTSNEKLVWAASSESGLSGSQQEIIGAYVSGMMRAMAKDGVLGR